jgi:hypothetical protein
VEGKKYKKKIAMQALVVSKPNHACVFSVANSNPYFGDFDSFN